MTNSGPDPVAKDGAARHGPSTQARAEGRDADCHLSPWRVRLIVYTVLIILALLAIWLVDQHVMEKQIESQPTPATHSTQP